MTPERRHGDAQAHHLRISACLVVSLLLLIGAVRLWPAPGGEDLEEIVYSRDGQELIELEDIQPTQQAQQKPPPPAPLPPVVVPDDEILDDIELDFSDSFLNIEEPGPDPAETLGATEGASTGLPKVQTAPKPVRFVEPEYTREARRRRVRAEVVVEVLVDERGQVEETKIVERFLLGKEEHDKTPVETLGYGLEEAAVSAAERWIFRPARQDGKAVRSYTTLTFSFGV